MVALCFFVSKNMQEPTYKCKNITSVSDNQFFTTSPNSKEITMIEKDNTLKWALIFTFVCILVVHSCTQRAKLDNVRPKPAQTNK